MAKMMRCLWLINHMKDCTEMLHPNHMGCLQSLWFKYIYHANADQCTLSWSPTLKSLNEYKAYNSQYSHHTQST
jgi:hypothetical protein